MSETKLYKSPIHKLLPFFEKSRDGWKEKHRRVKAQNKLLSNQVRAVEKSRERWRQQAEQEQRRVRALEQELEELKTAHAGTASRGAAPHAPAGRTPVQL